MLKNKELPVKVFTQVLEDETWENREELERNLNIASSVVRSLGLVPKRSAKKVNNILPSNDGLASSFDTFASEAGVLFEVYACESTPRLYNIWQDENGDYYGDGHIEPSDFKKACEREDIEEYGIFDLINEGSGEMELSEVKHEWWYQPRADNDELLKKCDKDHPGAFPITAWRR